MGNIRVMVAGGSLRLRIPQACWPLYPRIFATVPDPCLCHLSSISSPTTRHPPIPVQPRIPHRRACLLAVSSIPGCVFANPMFQLELGMADELPLPLKRILYSVERSARVSTRATPARRCHHGKLTIVPTRHPGPFSLLPFRRHKYPGNRHRNSGKARIGTRYRRRTRTHHLSATCAARPHRGEPEGLHRGTPSHFSTRLATRVFCLPVQDLRNCSGLFQPVFIRSSHTASIRICAPTASVLCETEPLRIDSILD